LKKDLKMIVRIAGITKESVVDGPGLRLVVFVQGCPHRCRGCQNPHTWDPEEGVDVSVGDLLEQIEANPLLKGITLSGGEPFMQPLPMAVLARAVRERAMDVITYTGYEWEKLLEMAETDPAVKQLLVGSDYLIDGPFIEEERELTLSFSGSRNQRIIDVKSSLATGKALLADWEGG
jgi:anaerobic ribonucleoside-triphosphate reductase activating protein